MTDSATQQRLRRVLLGALLTLLVAGPLFAQPAPPQEESRPPKRAVEWDEKKAKS